MLLARTLFAVLALGCLFSACKKEDSPEASDKLLQRVTSDNDSLLSTTFHYDAQHRLIEIIDSNRQGHIRETSVEYNAAGNPVKFITLHHAPPGSFGNKTEDSLVYANNRVVKKLYKSPSKVFKLINSYSYDANGRAITDTAYSYWSDDIVGYTQFTYDGNDDIVQYQFFNNSSGVMDNLGSTTVSYNAVENPYNSLGLTLYIVTGDYLFLGKHNKTKVILNWRSFEQYTIEYTYAYNSDGLPNKMVLNRSYGGRPYSVSSFNFYYQ